MSVENQKESEFFENYVLSEPYPYIDRFDDERLSLKREVLDGIYGYGFDRPSPIQRIGIKPIADAKDLVLQSHSGTGKTATFLTGVLQRVNFEDPTTQAVVVCNTKELADQVYDVLRNLSKYCDLKAGLCIGGDMSNRYMMDSLDYQVIVGTPGRICDLMSRNIIRSNEIQLLVIDEADEILSTGFQKQIKMIINRLNKECQIVLSSATIPPEMRSIIDNVLRRDYVSILVKDAELTLEEISQYYVPLDDYQKNETLVDIYNNMSVGQCIIYCNKKHRADELKHFLSERGFMAGVLHGDMLSNERREMMEFFRDGRVRILITTDVMARGIDVQQLTLVFNYDMPKYAQTYIHRIGRSGRFGRQGVAINFVTRKEKSIINYIERTFSTKIYPLPSNLKNLIKKE
jgi:superfamily II DNA/RNA helicase